LRELKSKKTIIGANASKCWNRRKKNGKMMNEILKPVAAGLNVAEREALPGLEQAQLRARCCRKQ